MESTQNKIERAVVRRCLQLNEEDRFITRRHFANLGAHTGLTDLELDIIFDALDTNDDGVILLDDLLYHSQKRNRDAFEEIEFFPESAESAHWSSTSSSESEFSPIDSGQPSSLDHVVESKSLCMFNNQNDNVIINDVNFNTVHRHAYCDENITSGEQTHDDFSPKSSPGNTDSIRDTQGTHFDVEDNQTLLNESPQLAASNYQTNLRNNNGRKSNQMENQTYPSEKTQATLEEYSPKSDIPNDEDFAEDPDALYELPTESSATVTDDDLNDPPKNVSNRDQNSALASPSLLSDENSPKLQGHSYGGSRLNFNQTVDDHRFNSPHSILKTPRKVSPEASNRRDTSQFGRTPYYNSSDIGNRSVFKLNLTLDNLVSCSQDRPGSDESSKKMHSTHELNFNPNDHKVTKDSPSEVTIRPVHSYSRFTGERVCGVKSQQVESNATTKSNKIGIIHRHDSYSNTVDSLNRIIDKATDSLQEENPVFSGLASPETVYEYDSSKIFPTPPSVRKLRHKSRRHDKLTKRRVLTPVQMIRQDVPGDLDLLSKLSQEQVCELYQNLHGAENPELVSQFENILLNVIKDVRQYKMENERLEKTYRREKDEHDKHLRRMEDEMELQVQSVEERVRKQEKEKLESEKIDLRIQLDSEITMLQQNLKKLQQDGMNRMEKNQEDHLLAMKKRLEEIQTENRSLKSELTDAQTNLALVKTEMSTVKQQLDEKAYELEVEKHSAEKVKIELDSLQFELHQLHENKTVEAYVNEQDSLRRQLQLLHEANKNLLDTNDNLREMLDTPPNGVPAFKRTTSTDSGASARSASPNFPRKGSVMSDYIDKSSSGNRSLLEQSFQKEVSMMPRFLGAQCQCDPYEEDSIAEELDSGHSTLRDINDANDDTETDSVSIHSDYKKGKRHRRHRSNLRVQVEEEPESHDEMDTDGETPLSPDPEMMGRSSVEHRRSASVGSRGSTRSHRSITREESILSQSSRSSRSSLRRQLPAIPKVPTSPGKAARDPDRMYKIALAGDAAVGKSTFIVRLCKGKFVANLSSTLGVDFQTKMLEFDNSTTALQLWDTAGQERFRSIARTYFRRADGVLLLYDVTYERSFLNIRDWVASIEEGAVKKVPIMLVGNKTDVRLELEQQGKRVVKYEDGLKLSKELDALFIETSAKDGSNISEAVIELTRILRTNEDLEVQTVGMQLHDVKDKRKNSCCKFS